MMAASLPGSCAQRQAHRPGARDQLQAPRKCPRQAGQPYPPRAPRRAAGERPRPSRVDSADLLIDTARFRRADQLAPGRVQINDSSVRIGHADLIARCLEALYQTAPFFLGEANTLALGRLRKRASYCGSEPLQVVF